jgi:outer membrane lipoprotein SlyB
MLVAVPAAGQRRADTNRVISVNYGVVTGTELVQLQSAAAGGAVVGGVIGALRGRGRSSGSQARSAAAGAAIGGIGTRILEGSNQAMEYTVRLNAGRDVRVITEPTGTRIGDCVSVEQGRQANVRRVSSVHCEMMDAEPTPALAAEATACDQAKQQLIDAEDDEALERAIRRVRILCED